MVMAHHTLRLEMLRRRTLLRRRGGDPWQVRVTRADGGQEVTRVPAGLTVYSAGHLHGQMCDDSRHMSEDDFLAKYGHRGGEPGGVREPRRPLPAPPAASAEAPREG